ncbi:MAG TPA: metallophosphoesterase [Isosphaeraceae bacterium]
MNQLAWLTDVHLNFVTPRHVDALCHAVREAGVDAVLLGGDIGEAPDVREHLERLDARLGLPIHFVLGNHDFYRGGIASVRAEVAALCDRIPRLCWLPRAGVVALTPTTGLVGHDGWADGRLGDYDRSEVLLNDYRLIEDFAGLDKPQRLAQLQALGDEAAAHFRAVLPEALGRFPHVLVLTHVPPFREACWHQGRISDNDWLPHFSCRAVGEVLDEARPFRLKLVRAGWQNYVAASRSATGCGMPRS